jgi:hypothetical protein
VYVSPPERETIIERRDRLIREIARLWRGDWSGTTFDGRDGQRMLLTALDGDSDALDSLEVTIAEIRASY